MVTLEEYVNGLLDYLKNNPDKKNLPVIYAADSTGTDLHFVTCNYPSSINTEVPHDSEADPNCILIN